MLFEIISTVSSGLFAGAAIYVNLVEHPARVEFGIELALREFAPSYRRATLLQGTLAAIGFMSGVAAWFSGHSLWWLIGGTVLGSVIPFTLIIVFPTNKKFLDPSLDPASEVAKKLLARWTKLHAVRSVLALTAFLICVFLLCLGRLR